MIGSSKPEYLFIRACIIFLHHIAPLSALYCVSVLVLRPSKYRIPLVLELWAVAETLFYLLVYLPRYQVLQRAAVHPAAAPRQNRRQLFELCHQTVEHPEQYLSKWFKNAPLSEIKRENLKEFYCWAFLNKGSYGLVDDEELEEYVDRFEVLLCRKLEPGRGDAVPLRLTIDKVNMLHRSLLWYFCVSVVDTITFVYMHCHSFRFHGLGFKQLFTLFPFRPLAIIGINKSSGRTLTYWYRPHTSKTAIPVLFIHGIGIGLYPYVNFLAQLNRKDTRPPDHRFAKQRTTKELDGDVGVIAIEVMPISFRITHAIPTQEQLSEEILGILIQHGWENVVLVTHSYGSVISTHLLQHEVVSSMIRATVLVDPVSILLHLPDVAYNFTSRKPRRANEYQLYYFASMDMGVAHTLARNFFWDECILWKQDMVNKDVTVVSSGEDLIVDTTAVARYLVATDNSRETAEWKNRPWQGEGLELLWFENLDHAQVFDSKINYDVLVRVTIDYAVGKAGRRPGDGLGSKLS